MNSVRCSPDPKWLSPPPIPARVFGRAAALALRETNTKGESNKRKREDDVNIQRPLKSCSDLLLFPSPFDSPPLEDIFDGLPFIHTQPAVKRTCESTLHELNAFSEIFPDLADQRMLQSLVIDEKSYSIPAKTGLQQKQKEYQGFGGEMYGHLTFAC